MNSRFQYVTSVVLIAATVFSFVLLSPIHAEPNLDPPDPMGKQTKTLAATLANPGFDNGDWYWDGYVPGANSSFVPSHWAIWYRDGTIPLFTRVTTKNVDGKEAVRGHAYWDGSEGLQAGLYQIIEGATPCLNYRFQMYGQAMPVEHHDVLYGLRVGVHPTGYAPSNKAVANTAFNQIVWGPAHTDACLNTWCLTSVTAEAQASKITVFMYAHMNARTGHDVIWDAGSFEQVARTDNLIDASQPLPAPSGGIYNIVVNKGTNSAAISWNTEPVATYGQLLYRVLGSGTWQYSGLHAWGATHQISLTGLQIGSTYEYVVVSYGYIGGTCKAIVSETAQFSLATPLTSVSIGGPATGYLGASYTFTANASPLDATTPVEYVWEATGKANVTHSGGLQDSVSFSWDTPGLKTIKVTATNAAGSVEDTHLIEIQGDAYEPDDTCNTASMIPTNGTRQARTFHTITDQDWVYFDAVSGSTYLVEALTPASSGADVSLDVYDTCGGGIVASQAYTYTPDVRLPFTATKTGSFYLFLRQDPSAPGTDMAYNLSVRTVPKTASPGEVVLVAGKLHDDDPLQSNIHRASEAVYQFFTDRGYDDDNIYYLSTDLSNPNVDDLPSRTNLDYAIQSAMIALASKPNSSFTLYMVGHGGHDKFYLNGSAQVVSPSDLNAWITALENATVGTQVNVIVDAPQAGSFIGSLSAEGRVVIASTGAQRLAWATEEGVLFSDYFVAALRRGLSLHAGFQEAVWAVKAAQPAQTPWLDDDGDGLPNEADEGTTAAQRGFISVGRMGEEDWPPYIAGAEIGEIVDGHGEITAEVWDDGAVTRVWAEIYPPNYKPDGEEELVSTSFPTVTLSPLGDGSYRAAYGGFSTLYLGSDRVVIYAMDDEGWMARPRSVGGTRYVYLPLVLRE